VVAHLTKPSNNRPTLGGSIAGSRVRRRSRPGRRRRGLTYAEVKLLVLCSDGWTPSPSTSWFVVMSHGVIPVPRRLPTTTSRRPSPSPTRSRARGTGSRTITSRSGSTSTKHITTGNYCAYKPPEGNVSGTVAFADRRPSGTHPPR
jgi:hypothetical protein